VHALELVVPWDQVGDRAAVVEATTAALGARFGAERCTLSFVGPGGDVHHTFVPTYHANRYADLHGMHPQAAERVGLGRLVNFALERLPGADDLYCFFGRSRTLAEDERFFVLADVRGQAGNGIDATAAHVAAFERAFHQAASALRALRSAHDPRRRLHWNRLAIFLGPPVALDVASMERIARRLAPATRHLGLEKVVVRARIRDRTSPAVAVEPVEVVVSDLTGGHMEITLRASRTAPLEPAHHYQRRVVEARRRRLVYPYEIIRMLTGRNGGTTASFEEYDLVSRSDRPRARSVGGRPHGENRAGIVFGILTTPTDKVPEGMRRVLILSDPTRDMGALAAPECDRIIAAIDLAEERRLPVDWVPISSGARIAMDSGTENLDATARVARRLVRFTERGGVVHLVVYGVNVGAQSYWDALATMLSHTRGALIMTPEASMVLTGRAALEASGSVAAEDEVALGGFERIMGPNGEAQYYAADLAAALRLLEEHHRYTYVVSGESAPRRHPTRDPVTRDVTTFPYPADLGHGFATVGDIFDDTTNPGRKRPFGMRAVMQALIDQDGGALERWRPWVGAQNAIVWDAHLGGVPISLIGIESTNVPRDGYRPLDGPPVWTGGTLFPRSSKKIARALNVASGNRPVVILANLSGFDGSPESLRSLQLEHGAEIARAVVRFDGPLFFVVVSRYHGGAYVVFSKALNPALRAVALTGSYASVIGGAPAAAVIFTREVRARAAADPTVSSWREVLRRDTTLAARDAYERALTAATRVAETTVAAEFDAVHTVERACRVGSLEEVIEPQMLRPILVHALQGALRAPSRSPAPREPPPSPDDRVEP
jgi:acetyl-CoA carboxylase carboxyltransferase component